MAPHSKTVAHYAPLPAFRRFASIECEAPDYWIQLAPTAEQQQAFIHWLRHSVPGLGSVSIPQSSICLYHDDTKIVAVSDAHQLFVFDERLERRLGVLA